MGLNSGQKDLTVNTQLNNKKQITNSKQYPMTKKQIQNKEVPIQQKLHGFEHWNFKFDIYS